MTGIIDSNGISKRPSKFTGSYTIGEKTERFKIKNSYGG